jgi:O-antigen/teichoic acid export membrane protein
MEVQSAHRFKRQVLYGLLWRFLERIGTQGIQFIISIILARLLFPKDYGMIALIVVFIAIANVFVQSGFGTALIQKKDVDDYDYSSVFYFGLFISIILYGILFNLAPFIAKFYVTPLLVPIIRIVSISIIIGAVNNIQNVVLSREMKFKKSFYINISGAISSGFVGIFMAYSGYGVWSLVCSSLTGQIVVTIVLWFTIKWRPKILFSFNRIKKLFAYSSKLLISSLLDTIFGNIYPLIIGKLFNQTMLGNYNRGQSIPALLVCNIDGAIQGVMFPALSKHQTDTNRMKELVRRMIVTSTFLVFPLMFGLAVIPKPLVLLILTEKWLSCVPFLQLSCITYAFWPLQTSNLQAINSLGRSDIFLKLEIIKKILLILVICISFPFGIYAMVAGSAILSLVSTFINSYPNLKLLNYSYKEQITDIMPSLLLSVCMGIIVYSIQLITSPTLLTLIFQVIIGIVVYITMAIVFKIECFAYLIDTVKNQIINRGGDLIE